MKKQITLLVFSLLLVMAMTLRTSSQQGNKNKGNKGQQENKGKSDRAEKGNHGKKDHNKDFQNKDQKKNQGKNENHPNMGQNNNKEQRSKGHNDGDNGYRWNHENFKDRKKIKNQDKVTICHKFNRTEEHPVTIRVSSNAVKAHMNHGDVMGDCPTVKDNRYSDVFMRNKTDYYNTLQNGQEQVNYSRSILDYALERLNGSRQQLAIMQNKNFPLAEVQRKQATVAELEQNVSLLETLVNVAVNIVANKLQ